MNSNKKPIEFHEFEEATTTTTTTKVNNNISAFGFINQNKTQTQNQSQNQNQNNYNTQNKNPNQNEQPQASNGSLIDLNSNTNLKDLKFKEASSNIFKLYDNNQQEVSNPNQNQNGNDIVYNNTTNNINFNSFPQIHIQNTICNPYNNQMNNQMFTNQNMGYNPNLNNMMYQQQMNQNMYRFNGNQGLSSYDLYNKGDKGNNNQTFNTNNIDLTQNSSKSSRVNDSKPSDPFKSLVNFK